MEEGKGKGMEREREREVLLTRSATHALELGGWCVMFIWVGPVFDHTRFIHVPHTPNFYIRFYVSISCLC